MMKALVAFGSALCFSSTAYAANINDLDVGDGVYLQGIFSDELVQIARVDQIKNRVKVRRSEDQTTKWVSPSSILTRDESIENDVTRWGLAVGLAICAFDPAACEDAGQNNGSQGNTQSLSSSSDPSGYKIKVINKCDYPLKFAMHYREIDDSWKTAGWWGVDANDHRLLNYTNGSYALTNSATTYFYAEAKGGDIYWGGSDITRTVDGERLGMKEYTDTKGDTEISLSCSD